MNKKATVFAALVCPVLLIAGLAAAMLAGCQKTPAETAPTGQTQSTPGGETTEETIYGLGDAVITPEDVDTLPPATDTTGPGSTVATEPETGKPTEGTRPADGNDPEKETTTPTQGESDAPGQDETTAPTEGTPEPTDPPALSWEEYEALSAEEQEIYMDSFTSLKAFTKWYNQALQDYEEGDVIEVTGPVDLGGLNR